jgi:hypothetical protein
LGNGPSGGGVLATLSVQPAPGLLLRAAPGNGIVSLLDTIATGFELRDTLDNPIDVRHAGDATLIIRALEGDVDSTCGVNVVDDQIIASRLGATSESIHYSTRFDLEPAVAGDGDVDLNDLQVVTGRMGSTCGNPQPFQEPPTPIPTPPAKPTPAPQPNFDTDGDGCTDGREKLSNPAAGGLRNYVYPWDFFDPNRDLAVDVDDIFAVAAKFALRNGQPGYASTHDRGSLIGPHVWNLNAPDGTIEVDDIFRVAQQFGHACA